MTGVNNYLKKDREEAVGNSRETSSGSHAVLGNSQILNRKHQDISYGTNQLNES